jgi:hypothetical protein
MRTMAAFYPRLRATYRPRSEPPSRFLRVKEHVVGITRMLMALPPPRAA